MAKLNAKYELMAVYSLAKGEEVAKELQDRSSSHTGRSERVGQAEARIPDQR